MADVIPSAPLITTQATDRCASFELAAHPGSAAQARRLTRAQLSGWAVPEETCDAATLVVSELVTNAIVHTGSRQIVCELRELCAAEEAGRPALAEGPRALEKPAPGLGGAPKVSSVRATESGAGPVSQGHPGAAAVAGAEGAVVRTGGGARAGGGARLRIAVRDEGHCGVPASPRQDPQDEHGRGLFLVAAVSVAWGTHETEHGSGLVVWAELFREEAR